MARNRASIVLRVVTCLVLISLGGLFPLSLKAQTQSLVLGRPTDTAITASLLFDQPMEGYIQYGVQTGLYTDSTLVFTAQANTPLEYDLHPLQPNTRYYYRLHYRPVGTLPFAASPEYTFHTQRAVGSSFTFTLEADEHLYDKKGVKSLYDITLANQAADRPDFMLSLGDIFGDDHEPFTITSGALDTLHRDYRPFLGKVCHSIPFYVCLGNHEGENDYYYGITPPDNLCIWATQWRKFYYPNPYPNGFYSGNTINEPYGIGSPENYYAWHWGNALFVVLDVYRDQCDTSAKPGSWNWSLGLPQYTWLKNTLEGSTAQYKFVFAHHISGQGRGGITNATKFEWGGYDGPNGTTYSFPNKRPGWAKPIHQLFKDNGVTIFFQGHDHVFAHEILDSIVYQAVPMAADSTYEIGMLANAGAYVSDTISGSGHLRVQVSPTCVIVDFVRAYLPADTVSGIHHNREIAFSYTLGNCPSSGIQHTPSIQTTIYPNPANNQLIIEDGLNKRMVCTITNVLGQEVLRTNEKQVAISHIPNGMYFLQIQTEAYHRVQKIIIQH